MSVAIFVNFILPLITPIIIIFAIINLIVWRVTNKAIKLLKKTNHPEANIRAGQQAEMKITGSLIDDLNKNSISAMKSYTWYANITAIFPLLGIFGTVVSLMNLSGSNDISANFAAALSTTFWGLVFAVIFKLADSPISAELERALDDADYLIHQYDEEKRMNYAAQAETRYRH